MLVDAGIIAFACAFFSIVVVLIFIKIKKHLETRKERDNGWEQNGRRKRKN